MDERERFLKELREQEKANGKKVAVMCRVRDDMDHENYMEWPASKVVSEFKRHRKIMQNESWKWRFGKGGSNQLIKFAESDCIAGELHYVATLRDIYSVAPRDGGSYASLRYPFDRIPEADFDVLVDKEGLWVREGEDTRMYDCDLPVCHCQEIVEQHVIEHTSVRNSFEDITANLKAKKASLKASELAWHECPNGRKHVHRAMWENEDLRFHYEEYHKCKAQAIYHTKLMDSKGDEDGGHRRAIQDCREKAKPHFKALIKNKTLSWNGNKSVALIKSYKKHFEDRKQHLSELSSYFSAG